MGFRVRVSRCANWCLKGWVRGWVGLESGVFVRGSVSQREGTCPLPAPGRRRAAAWPKVLALIRLEGEEDRRRLPEGGGKRGEQGLDGRFEGASRGEGRGRKSQEITWGRKGGG